MPEKRIRTFIKRKWNLSALGQTFEAASMNAAREREKNSGLRRIIKPKVVYVRELLEIPGDIKTIFYRLGRRVFRRP